MNTEKQNEIILKETQELINLCPSEVKEQLSDGYHTFKELYEFRKVYNAALFNEWSTKQVEIGNTGVTETNPYKIHKSWKHYDGELCFGGGWFIVVAVLPTGQISNHYEAEHWDKFRIPSTDKALFLYDNHQTDDVINRLLKL